jgi:hypothetical protein
MKKLFTILATIILTVSLFAQSPEKMSYQAVIRNSSDALITNTQVGMQISILKGSASGTVVYAETQAPTTNSNGLVSIEIGGGTGFDTINWASGPYFIKTETDPDGSTGGIIYTITGTSQLLSVPYALHAKTAETITGVTHYVGELYGGGVVFWVDQTGQHGLICSMIDLSTDIMWTTADYQTTTVPGGALSDWDGQANTTAIVNQAGTGTTYAAGLCDAYTNADYGTGVYSDWYLPARGELNHLWNNIYQVQKALDSDGNPATTAVAKEFYWSSSEWTIYGAWNFYFGYGRADVSNKYGASYVRAVRVF